MFRQQLPSLLLKRSFLQATRKNRLSSLTRMAQVIYAPSDDKPRGVKSVFLAGTTSKVDEGDWRETLAASLSDVPVTLFNPYRADWDGSWREDVDFAPYRGQVEWELARQDEADLVVVYFHPATQAPISLLELGLSARVPGKVVVCCPEGYWKRGNVLIVCERFGIETVESVEGLREAIVKRVSTAS
jgi:hypothetical protein